jgi:hypothetical protein
MIHDFANSAAMITHPEQGVYSGNLRGFDFPDLGGSSPSTSMGTLQRGLYDDLRAGDVLGVSSIINDWSNNAGLNVATDWVVTFPGQYLMLDLPRYFTTLGNFGGLDTREHGGIIGEGDGFCTGTSGCDNRDIPVIATFLMWDREENPAEAPPGDRDVVISPSIPGLPPVSTVLRYETNVVHWADREVFDSQYDKVDISDLRDLLEADSGWAKLLVTSGAPLRQTTPQICSWVSTGSTPEYNPLAIDPNTPVQDCQPVAEAGIPMIGFVAWERSFPDNPDGNYGRAVAHSFESGAGGPFVPPSGP